MDRRTFLRCGTLAGIGTYISCGGESAVFSSAASLFDSSSKVDLPELFTGRIMTGCGDISPSKMGVALASESLVRDQSGAEADAVSHYDMESAFRAILPELMQLKQLGGGTVIDTVSVYAGRNVKFLQRLSRASELNVLTNTGYDGTEGNKYVPIELQKESAEDIAFRWIKEGWYGIGEAKIRPGFIKIGVDGGGLSSFHAKLFQASALAHFQTGLPVMVDCMDFLSLSEGMSLLRKAGLSAEGLIWSCSAMPEEEDLLSYLYQGGWFCLKGIKQTGVNLWVKLLCFLKEKGFLGRVLVSPGQDWIVNGTFSTKGEKSGLSLNQPYRIFFNSLLEALSEVDFSRADIRTLTEKNPRKAFEVGVRRAGKQRKKYFLF